LLQHRHEPIELLVQRVRDECAARLKIRRALDGKSALQGYDRTRGGCLLKDDSATVRRIAAFNSKSIGLQGSVQENFQVS
jgi:hypothetical protein